MGCLLSQMKHYASMIIAILVCAAAMPLTSFAADVDVYAEGAYTDTQLDIYIYADINTSPILSFGVRVNYPAGLTFASAAKNETVWYLGNGSAISQYMEPENDGTGVVIIGGKIDTADPLAGVTGTRVLLGKVHFTHSGMTDFSGVSITYGRGDGTGSYKNFVSTSAAVYDGGGVGFSTAIHERGDGNGDGVITSADMFSVRSSLGGPYIVWKDCNADDVLTSADMFCVKSKL